MHNANRITIHGIIAVLLLWLPAAVMAAPVNDSFDHFTTGFPLTGGHRSVECDACHTTGTFAGTARECATCHSATMNTGAVVKSGFHIQSSNECDTCHSTLAWDDVRRVNHMAVLGTCKSCHFLGGPATPPPNDGDIHNNPATMPDCIACHRTSTWVAMHYAHGASSAGNCNNCHARPAGTIPGVPTVPATVAPSNYHQTAPKFTGAASCDDCHNTRAWTPTPYTHDDVDGMYASIRHSFTRLSCDGCHSRLGGIYDRGTALSWNYAPAPNCLVCHESDAAREHSIGSINPVCTDCHDHANSLNTGDWD